MKLTLLFLVCTAALAAQGKYVAPNSDVASYDLIEDIKKLFEQLKQMVINEVNKAIEKLKEMLEEIKAIVGGIVAEAKATIDQIISDVKEKLDDLMNWASEVGKGAVECVNVASGEIAKLPDETINKVQACADNEIVKANKIINDAIILVEKTIRAVNEIEDKISQCGVDLNCWTNVANEIKALVASLPAEIERIIENAAGFISDIDNDVEECVSAIIEGLKKDVASIVKEAEQCITNIANGNN